jgi:hypothetical protein
MQVKFETKTNKAELKISGTHDSCGDNCAVIPLIPLTDWSQDWY